MKNDLRYWLGLLRAPGMGPTTILNLVNSFPDLEMLFNDHPDVWNKTDWERVEKDLVWLESSGSQHIITIKDVNYPSLLKQIYDPPPLLFVKGNVSLLSAPQLAIVGSRNPTSLGTETAFAFAQHLAKTTLSITSGLAIGIDAASHRGVLSINGKTIAVVGTSLETCYPNKHQKLAQEILQNDGAIVSEFPLGTPALAENFPRRNRIISGLSVGTLVVEATLRSGSLITARCAMEQGREVFAIPGSIHNPLARGCHALIQQGAKLVGTVEDILQELGPLIEFTGQATMAQPVNKLAEQQQKLLNCMGFEPTSMDIIIERSGLAAQNVAAELLTLELQGYITTTTRGYQRVKI